MNITTKGIILVSIFIVMAAGLIFLGLRTNDCTQAYNNGLNYGLTQLINKIQTDGIALIGLPNNQTFKVTHPSLCEAIVNGGTNE